MWFLSIRNSFQFFHLWCSSRIPPTIPRGLVVGRGRQNLRTSSICCPSTRRCTVTQVGFGTLFGGDTAQYGYAEFGAFENPMVYFQQNDPMKWETPLWLKVRAPRLQNWLRWTVRLNENPKESRAYPVWLCDTFPQIQGSVIYVCYVCWFQSPNIVGSKNRSAQILLGSNHICAI